MMKKHGFTLAEVLITLGIIGVVAAMTIPTLMANTNGAKFRSQYKKSVSTLNQAALMGIAQYEFDFSGAGACADTSSATGGEESPNNGTYTVCSLLNGTLSGAEYVDDITTLQNNGAPYANSVTMAAALDGSSFAPANYHAYKLADGSLFVFHKDAAKCHVEAGQLVKDRLGEDDFKNCVGYIDVNGASAPNKEVTCKDGETTLTVDAAAYAECTVPNSANNMTDIFPVVFHDSAVEPLTNASKYVLTTAK